MIAQDGDAFVRAAFDWDGRIEVTVDSEHAAHTIACLLGLPERCEPTVPVSVVVPSLDTRDWRTVEWSGVYAGHAVKVRANWLAPSPGLSAKSIAAESNDRGDGSRR